jgi:hypothetical protein
MRGIRTSSEPDRADRARPGAARAASRVGPVGTATGRGEPGRAGGGEPVSDLENQWPGKLDGYSFRPL